MSEKKSDRSSHQIPNTAMILRGAIASFLYSEWSGFADSKPGRGQ
ncbi:hypothetical protein QUA70_21645 [Microcoleus sp. LAD1_D5]